jgi:hypothetical protein
MTQRFFENNDRPYKHAFVDFIRNMPWHFFITIPIGQCDDPDDVILMRLRRIENALCHRYLVCRYDKLPTDSRYSFAAAFEGEREVGTRHVHILAYIPVPTKCSKHSLTIQLFPSQFKDLWVSLRWASLKRTGPQYGSLEWADDLTAIRCTPANTARHIYTAKRVRQRPVSWSRFEFVTLPKRKPFRNRNLNVIQRRNLQRRRQLGLITNPQVKNNAA